MDRAVKFVDVPVSEDRNIPFEMNEKIMGISITNTGTDDVSVAMGSENAIKTLQANDSTEYGNASGGDSIFYLIGNLVIKKSDGTAWAATTKVIITYAYDKTDFVQNDC